MPHSAQEVLAGSWQMVHDGWVGSLVVDPIDQAFNAVDGNCTYHYYEFSGTWTGGDGAASAVQGTCEGKDTARRKGEPCPSSPHIVKFTIAFPGPPRSNLRVMSLRKPELRWQATRGGTDTVRVVRNKVIPPELAPAGA